MKLKDSKLKSLIIKTHNIKLIINQFPPCKKMGDLHRLDVTESKKVDQIAPSPTIIEREIFQLMYHLFAVQRNSFSACLFPECFSEVKYITFLPETTGQLLLYLWRIDINSTNEGAINIYEKN